MMTHTEPSPSPADAASGTRTPRHVAIIMDGNGRWAAQRGRARMEGHEAGTENIRRITFRAGELGVQYLTLWAFSTENWRRPQAEVAGLMEILGRAIASETEDLHRQGARLQHIGDLDALEPHLRGAIADAIELTRNNTGIVLTLAFNYGGRHEVIRAIRRIVAAGIAPESITEELVGQHLYTSDIPDPDLILRTSGEYRTSNFLIWQSVYAEWIFSQKLWPDFGPDDLADAIAEYSRRDRRYGALTSTTG